MKQPAIQFYVGDWRKDMGIQSLSYEERGVWFEMLLLMFESKSRGKLCFEEGIPMPEEALARCLGIDKQKCNQILSKLISYGVAKVEADTGVVYCKRMVEDAQLSETRKMCGRLGGNPNLVNQNSTKIKNIDNQNPTPSSSPSFSNNIKEKNIKKENLLNESAERIWQAYPKKDGKMKGIEAIVNALKRGESEEYLIERVKLYSQSRSVLQGFIMNAQGWFNQKRYTDESLDKPIPQGDVNCITLEEFKHKFNTIYDYNGTDIYEDSTDYNDKMILFVRKLKSVNDFKTKYPNEYANIINRKDK